jgi:hypothetical protein
MLDQNSIFHGVRISKRDGDDEYKWFMTRPDPPYLPPPVERKQIEAPKPTSEQPQEGLVIQEVKTPKETTGPKAVSAVERVVHAQGPSAQAFAYLVIMNDEEGPFARAWAWLTQGVANALIDDQGVEEHHIDFETNEEVAEWFVSVFVAIAVDEFAEDGIAEPTPELVQERTSELFAAYLEAQVKEVEEAEAAEVLNDGVGWALEDDEWVFHDEHGNTVPESEWYKAAEAATDRKAKLSRFSPTYWWTYLTIWLRQLLWR